MLVPLPSQYQRGTPLLAKMVPPPDVAECCKDASVIKVPKHACVLMRSGITNLTEGRKRNGSNWTKIPRPGPISHRSKRHTKNQGVSRHRPKTMQGGERVGEASNPGPTCQAKHCNHNDCTMLGHHHRPKGKSGASRRAQESKGKNGSSKPSRFKPCMLHLEAGQCGVDLPHGHCSCPEEHFHDLLTAHIADETRHDSTHPPRGPWERSPAEHAAEEQRLTSAFNSFEFKIGEAKQQNALLTAASAPDTPSNISSDFNFAAFADRVPANAEKKESFADDDDDTSSDSDSDDEDEEIEYVWNDDWISKTKHFRHQHFAEPPAGPATRKLLVFTAAIVGDENLRIVDRFTNWLKLHLPLTRTTDSTLVNPPHDSLIAEHVTLLPTTTQHVNWFWKTPDSPGWELSAAEGDLQFFRKLLPACREAEIYSSIYDAALLDIRLNKQEVITKDLQISRSLGPIVRDFVYTQAATLVGAKPSILVWTVVAIMNALTASGIVTRMSGNGQGLDFRTWGRYHHR